MKRGHDSVRQHADAMIDTLNLPKNSAKSHWSGMTLEDLRDKLAEEFEEVMTEIDIVLAGGDIAGLVHEPTDLSCVSMMLREWAVNELVRRVAAK